MFDTLQRYRGVIAIGVLLVSPLILLYAETRNPSTRGPVVGVIVDVAGIIERGLLGVTGVVSDGLQRYVTATSSMDELYRLRSESVVADVHVARIAELERENEVLRKLAHAAARIDGPRPLAARIIGRSGEPLSRIARVDRGTNDGVRRGDAVVSSAGVIGRVLAAGIYSSDVLLLSDPSSVVDAVVQRTRARGLVRGSGDADGYRARIEDFDRLADVHEGDLVVTSGLDGAFPSGFPIGRVTLVEERADGLYRRADVNPLAALSTLEHVLLLIRRPPMAVIGIGGSETPEQLILDEGPPPPAHLERHTPPPPPATAPAETPPPATAPSSTTSSPPVTAPSTSSSPSVTAPSTSSTPSVTAPSTKTPPVSTPAPTPSTSSSPVTAPSPTTTPPPVTASPPSTTKPPATNPPSVPAPSPTTKPPATTTKSPPVTSASPSTPTKPPPVTAASPSSGATKPEDKPKAKSPSPTTPPTTKPDVATPAPGAASKSP